MRQKKKAGNLKRGPFSADDVERALVLDGWRQGKPGGKHAAIYEHPTKPGKIPVKNAWSGLRAGCPIVNGLARTMGVSKRQLLELLNGISPE